MMIMYMYMLFVLLFVLLLLSLLISHKNMKLREKITPFECGFDPLVTFQVSFFISFYLFSLIFLVFDVEIVLLLPVVLVLKNMYMSYISMLLFIYFIILLMGGLYIEWLDGSLEWSS